MKSFNAWRGRKEEDELRKTQKRKMQQSKETLSQCKLVIIKHEMRFARAWWTFDQPDSNVTGQALKRSKEHKRERKRAKKRGIEKERDLCDFRQFGLELFDLLFTTSNRNCTETVGEIGVIEEKKGSRRGGVRTFR
jgi:hypothetical protein